MPGSSAVSCCPDTLPDTIRITLAAPACSSSSSSTEGFPMIGRFIEVNIDGKSSSIGENIEDVVEGVSSSGSELDEPIAEEI